MNVLEANEVRFSYESKEVLKGLNFTIGENEIVSILGPNGVGKTTLLRCICNMHKPSHGSIKIMEKDISSVSSKEMAKLVGYVPQKADVSRSTVFDSVLIGRKPYMGLSFSDNDLEIAWRVMESMGLGDMSLDYVDEISGGEFQKVQIARAITQEPSILILDEPSNNLDIANQHMTMRMIKHVVREHGLTAIMTMHDINLALSYSDKFMFMKDGNIVAFGGKEVVTSDVIKKVYGIDADVIEHKGQIVVVPDRVQPQYDHLVKKGVGGHHELHQ